VCTVSRLRLVTFAALLDGRLLWDGSRSHAHGPGTPSQSHRKCQHSWMVTHFQNMDIRFPCTYPSPHPGPESYWTPRPTAGVQNDYTGTNHIIAWGFLIIFWPWGRGKCAFLPVRRKGFAEQVGSMQKVKGRCISLWLVRTFLAVSNRNPFEPAQAKREPNWSTPVTAGV
jgi:hypothetical protein